MSARAKRSRNLLDGVPVRNRRWEMSEAGTVRILEPRFGTGVVGEWATRVLRARPIEIRLDEVGTAVWQACDGRSPVVEIAARLQQDFGERVDPVHERLASFLRHMERNRFIRWAGESASRARLAQEG